MKYSLHCKSCQHYKTRKKSLDCTGKIDCPFYEKKGETFDEIAIRISKLVSEKNIKYGNSFEKCVKFFKILYPKGIKTKQYQDLLTLTRIFDKIMRISQGHKEDSWEDIIGYCLLSIERERRMK